MKRIFAGWRSSYISSPQKKGICVFCEAFKSGENSESLVLYKGKKVFVILNRFPYTTGHLMIVPKRHISHPSLLREDENLEMTRVLTNSIKIIEECYSPQGLNIGMNIGKSAGAGIDEHIHIHVVPRWEGDTNFMCVVADVRIIPELPIDSFKKLSPCFQKLKMEQKKC